ncbi:DUF4136 domain-containing protein [Fulvivirga lutimaris]|uniref:DUF4136 domain-containing protein n=1 Tax=Fulvivirga lutimaris TaxID=1819566 RepID=UPI0012BBA3FA|nr:DUF4136 domain-containing protein [Fulvivirga lutimaris]MTI40444.1 DUF4136 domain-containing protein [Fulvivirga lutimaris]
MKRLLIIPFILLLGCAELKMHSSKDPNADFSKYTTWCWMNGCTPTFEGPDYIYAEEALNEMVNLIAVEMQNKGYVQGDDASDLLVNFKLVLEEDSAIAAVVHEESLPLWEHYQDKDPYYHFLKGTLILDIADREKGQIIWRSVTQKYLPKYPTMNSQDAERGVKKALKDFPARAQE